jgi:hypothetical protein
MKNASACRFLCALILGVFLSIVSAASAANTLNYQGRVISGGTAFTGSGQFKFALVSADGSTIYWKNDGTTDSAAPTSAVPLTVTKGIFSVRLGDTSFSNMASISSNVFANTSMALRVWFSDGVTGFEQLSPDSVVNANVLGNSGTTKPTTLTKYIRAFDGDFTRVGLFDQYAFTKLYIPFPAANRIYSNGLWNTGKACVVGSVLLEKGYTKCKVTVDWEWAGVSFSSPDKHGKFYTLNINSTGRNEALVYKRDAATRTSDNTPGWDRVVDTFSISLNNDDSDYYLGFSMKYDDSNNEDRFSSVYIYSLKLEYSN